MSAVKTKTTYLEMSTPPCIKVSVPQSGLEISQVKLPNVDFYLGLYRAVGLEFQWIDRLVMPEQELRTIIHDDLVDVFVLTRVGKTVGYSELDRRIPGEIELAYFGLFPEVIGQGLGNYLLNWTLRMAWSHQPRRVWVHTCDLAHPAALPNYLKYEFEVYDQIVVDQWIPTEEELPGW